RCRWLKCGRQFSGSRVGPAGAGQPHIVGLDVERTETEGILAQVRVKVPINKSPIKTCIESYEHRCASVTDLHDPVAEALHGGSRYFALFFQLHEGKAA